MQLIPFLRQFRFGPFAIFDFAASYLGVYLLSPLLIKLLNKLGVKTTKASWLWLTLPIGVLIHILFKQFTPFTLMFIDLNGGYLAKLLVVVMLYLGFRDFKRVKKEPREE